MSRTMASPTVVMMVLGVTRPGECKPQFRRAEVSSKLRKYFLRVARASPGLCQRSVLVLVRVSQLSTEMMAVVNLCPELILESGDSSTMIPAAGAARGAAESSEYMWVALALPPQPQLSFKLDQFVQPAPFSSIFGRKKAHY
jgi:hypothetical protein